MAARKRTLTRGTMWSAPNGVEGERESFIVVRGMGLLRPVWGRSLRVVLRTRRCQGCRDDRR
jgi:hypothetical protein